MKRNCSICKKRESDLKVFTAPFFDLTVFVCENCIETLYKEEMEYSKAWRIYHEQL